MTTIATDGKTIAADGRAVYGGVVVESRQTKIVVRRDTVFASCGGSASGDAAIDWYLAGADPGHAPKGKWTLIVIKGVGSQITVFNDEEPYADAWFVPAAFGTGHVIARTAMRCGKSPAEAVAIAAELDPDTGGEIQVVDIAEALGIEPGHVLRAAE